MNVTLYLQGICIVQSRKHIFFKIINSWHAELLKIAKKWIHILNVSRIWLYRSNWN